MEDMKSAGLCVTLTLAPVSKIRLTALDIACCRSKEHWSARRSRKDVVCLEKNGWEKVGGMTGTGLGVATALWECTPGRRFRNGERGDGVASYSGGGGMSMVERLMH